MVDLGVTVLHYYLVELDEYPTLRSFGLYSNISLILLRLRGFEGSAILD